MGRLDKDSEGLLILTNDKSLNNKLLSPAQKHRRSYFVQVEHDITDKAITLLENGVDIKLDSGMYHTRGCSVKKLYKVPVLPERNPPVRFRENIPTSWALIELTEGKNRQVRKMFASVGFPVLRLVRIQIEDLKIGKLEPGQFYEIKQNELFKLLKIDIEKAVEITTKPKSAKVQYKPKSASPENKPKPGHAPWKKNKPVPKNARSKKN